VLLVGMAINGTEETHIYPCKCCLHVSWVRARENLAVEDRLSRSCCRLRTHER